MPKGKKIKFYKYPFSYFEFPIYKCLYSKIS